MNGKHGRRIGLHHVIEGRQVLDDFRKRIKKDLSIWKKGTVFTTWK